MSRFGKGGSKTLPAISTSSLPDVIFMLLFFFMITTVLRDADVKVEITPPTASQVKKLEEKALVSTIYIGKPINKKIFGTLPRIQLNDAYAEPEQIRDFIVGKREMLKEQDRNKMTISLKIDKSAEMGVVTDVKQELRKASALKINYSSFEGDPVKALNQR
jgi:biopolymer transport protein ExbD